MVEKDSTLAERTTWNDGDLVMLDKDDKPIDTKKPTTVEEDAPGGPMIHIYLPEEEEGEK